MKDKIIAKQKEVINEYTSMDFGCMCIDCKNTRKRLLKLHSELAVLEQESKEDKLHTEYTRAYWQDLEDHEIHDDINEDKRDGTLIN